MTRHTDCHAGQQQQPGLAQRVNAARNRWCQVIYQRADQMGHYLASIRQMAPPKRGRTHLIIALLLIYQPRKDERLSWPSSSTVVTVTAVLVESCVSLHIKSSPRLCQSTLSVFIMSNQI